jgi:predicted neuraminidase
MLIIWYYMLKRFNMSDIPSIVKSTFINIIGLFTVLIIATGCEDEPEKIPVTGVDLSQTSLILNVDSTANLVVNIEPQNATNTTHTWESSDTLTATVSASGLVTGIAEGSANITVTTEDGGFTAECEVTVPAEVIRVTGVSISPATASLDAGDTTRLTATVEPLDATNQNMSWSSDDTTVAVVSPSGLVSGVKEGSVIITVTTEDGYFEANSEVTVSEVPQGDPILLSEYVFTNSPTSMCHASSVLELENGDLLCVWYGGSSESASDVKVWFSRKPSGGKWTTPAVIADGHGNSVWNPVLFQPRGGDVMCFYKCPDINTGEVVSSSDGGLTWSDWRAVGEGLTGPIVNKPVQLDDGTIISPSSEQEGGSGREGWTIHVERSTDNGLTWTKIGPWHTWQEWNVIQPTVLVHSQTRLQLLMRHGIFTSSLDTKMPTCWSEDAGLTWSAIETITLPQNNSGLDAVTLTDGRHILVYNHSTRGTPDAGGKGRGILNVAVSTDGVNWEAALVLDYRDDDSRFTYPAVIQSRDGKVHVTYTWNRDRIKHVVIHPKALETWPIVNGEWPKDKIPWIESR